MTLNLSEQFTEKNTLLVVIPPTAYVPATLEIATQLHTGYSRITYVSLNKLITPLRRSLQNSGLDIAKFSFIDGITKTAIASPPPVDQCVFIPAPNDLTKLGIALTNNLQQYDPDCVLFDSLSTLLIYEDVSVVTQFVYTLINKIHAYGIKVVFTCLAGNKEAQLINNLSLLVDGVISIDTETTT